MDTIAIVVLLVGLIAGYGLLQSQRERRLTERLKKTRDPNLISSEVDSAILRSQQESEFFKRNSGHRL